MTRILTLNPAIALSRNGINVLQKASNSSIWANFVKKSPRHLHAQSSNFLDSSFVDLMDT